jgi:hypothetical protein
MRPDISDSSDVVHGINGVMLDTSRRVPCVYPIPKLRNFVD